MSESALTLDQLERVSALLQAVKGVSEAARPRATFLELTGHSHLEAVASNLLKFFLDSNAEHGLGHLFLDALLQSAGVQGLRVTSVETEVVTRAGKKLDLVIESDSHVVGIENKILAGLYNPWDDYWQHVRELAGTSRAPLLLLLLVRAPKEGAVPEFVRVATYEELMAQARTRLGQYASGAPAQYVSFALDFIQTMENRYARSGMNPKILELLARHSEEALAITEGIKEFGKLATEKAAQLEAAVMEALGEPPHPVKAWGFLSLQKIRRCQVFEVKFPNASVAVDVYLTPRVWEVSVHERSEPKGGNGPMQTWLRSLPLPMGPSSGGVTVEEYERIITARFPFETPPEAVAEHVTEVVALVCGQVPPIKTVV